MKRFKVDTRNSEFEIDADAIAEGYDHLTFVKFKNNPMQNNRDYEIVAQFSEWLSWMVLDETESS